MFGNKQPLRPETIMKTPFTYAASGLAAAAIGAAVALAPATSATTLAAPIGAATSFVMDGAGTDPLVPFGPEPQVPSRLGYIDSNHDEVDTTNGQADLPF